MGGNTRFTVYTVHTLKFNVQHILPFKGEKYSQSMAYSIKICYLQQWFGQTLTLNYMTLEH